MPSLTFKAFLLLLSSACGLLRPVLYAQAPDVPIETQLPLLQNEAILAKAGKLREAGRLIDTKKVAEQVKSPMPAAIDLPQPGAEPIRGRAIASRARKAYLRLGWYYLCPRCDKWHLEFAGAYAISRDAIVTCHHCVVPKTEMREGFLIAVDSEGSVHPVTSVLARSQTMDAVILRVEGANLTPLPLQDNVAPGDTAYCFSEPLGQLGYFSTGVVNRFYWQRSKQGVAGSLDELKALRMNVSTDWAPGSSGAAVLDECGNVIGHVATISPMGKDGRAGGGPPGNEKSGDAGDAKKRAPATGGSAVFITLHEAIPARAVRALAESAGKAASAAIEADKSVGDPAR